MALTKSITYQETTYPNAYIRISGVTYSKQAANMEVDFFSEQPPENTPCLFQGRVYVDKDYFDSNFTVDDMNSSNSNVIKQGYEYLKQVGELTENFPISVDFSDAVDA